MEKNQGEPLTCDKLTPPEIARTCSLEEAVEAYRQVDSGASGGKIVFTFPH